MTQPDTIRQILVATDGSAGAQLAVEEGVRLAKVLGAKLIFVTVARGPLGVLGDPYYQRALTADLAKARAAIASASVLAEERQVPFETEIIEGTPAETIVDLARSRDVDLIVVGSRRRGAVTRAMLGSVSSDVVHRADRPVLVAGGRQASSEETARRRAA